jgi:hypothetical protein
MNGDTIEDIIEEVQERELQEKRDETKWGNEVENDDE